VDVRITIRPSALISAVAIRGSIAAWSAGGKAVGFFHDDVGFGKTGFDIAFTYFCMMGDVGSRLGQDIRDMSVVGHVGMENRSIRSNAVLRRSNGRQLRVVNSNKPGRLLGGSLIIRHHRDDRLSEIEHPVDGQGRFVSKIQSHTVREVPAAEHTANTGNGPGIGIVDRVDKGMSQRTGHQGCVEHSRNDEIVSEAGSSMNLIRCVLPGERDANLW
jgi:hypothetical protein